MSENTRKELLTPLDVKPETVMVKAHAEGYSNNREGCSHWVRIPANIFRTMVGMVRGAGEDKALPYGFMGGVIVTSVRVPYEKGRPKHRAIIIRKYTDEHHASGPMVRYSVHWLLAQSDEDAWDGWMGEYDIPSFGEAFTELTRRVNGEKALRN